MKRDWLVVLGLSLLFYLVFYHPVFVPGVSHVDTKVFANVLIAKDLGIDGLSENVPLGYFWLINLLPFSFITFSKFIPLLFMGLSSFLLFMLFNRMRGRRFAYIGLIIFLFLANSLEIFQGATHRGLVFPLLFLYIIFFSNRIVRLGLSILSLFIYPTLVSVLLLHQMIYLFFEKKRKKSMIVVLVLTIVVGSFVLVESGGYEYVNYNQADRMVEFTPEGMAPFFYTEKSFTQRFLNYMNPLFIAETLLDKEYYDGYSTLFDVDSLYSGLWLLSLIVLFFVFLFFSKDRIDYSLMALGFSGVLLYFVAHISFYLFHLGVMFFPASYTKFVLPFFLIYAGTRVLAYLRFPLVLIVIPIVLFPYQGFDFDDPCPEIGGFNGTLLVHPKDSECLPHYGQYSLMIEAGYPFYIGKYKAIREKIYDNIDDYYGSCEGYKLNNDYYYSEEYLKNPDLPEPFASYVANKTALYDKANHSYSIVECVSE